MAAPLESLADTFRNWGISEEVIKNFEDRKITVDLIPYISEKRLTELIPSEGDLLRLNLNYQRYLQTVSTAGGSKGDNSIGNADSSEVLLFNGTLNDLMDADLEALALLPDAPNAFTAATTDDKGESAQVENSSKATKSNVEEHSSTIASAASVLNHSETTVTADTPATSATTNGPSNSAINTLPPTTSEAIPGCTETSTSAPAGPNPPGRFMGTPIDLRAILEAEERGRVILATYRQRNSLNQAARDSLARILIINELGKDLNGRITPERFDYFATKVVELFPSENKGVWFVCDSRNRCITGKGKLYVCWYSLRRKWQSLGLISCCSKEKQNKKRDAECFDDDNPDEDSPEANDAVQWLKNSVKPWVTVEKHWKDSIAIRRRRILYENIEVIETLNEFPALKDQRGYNLLEIDFDNIYPDSSLKLYAAWPALCDFFTKKIRERKKSFGDNVLTPDGKTALVLSSLSQAFSVVTARRLKDTIKDWRPSRSEAQEAFVLHIETIASLDTKLNERREKLLRFGCHMQPVTVLVGPIEKISQCFVVLDDNYKYEVETPLKALDITFKCFHSLHATYPPEASQIWQFFQRAVYGIPRNSQYDPYFSGLETVIQEYNNSLR